VPKLLDSRRSNLIGTIRAAPSSTGVDNIVDEDGENQYGPYL
jgi:hypothetical protein